MVDIRTNLLKHRQTLSEKDYQREREILRWSVVTTIIVVVVVAALATWDFILSNQLTGIKTEIEHLNGRMQGLVTASAQQIYLKNRLKLVTGFLSDRSLVREGLQRVFSTNIPGTHIASVSFLTPIVMGLQVQADSVKTLNDALAYYQADAGYFTQVVSRGLSRSKDGSYQLFLELTLPTGAKQ
jgi:hypothetical protein